MSNNRYYDVIEAAELLETSKDTVCMLVNKGELDMLMLDTKSNPVFAERHLLDYMIKNEK